MIEPVAQRQCRAKLGQFPGQIGQQAGDVGLAQRRRSSPDQHRRRPEPLDLEPQCGQLARRAFQPVAFDLVQLDRLGDQQRLPRDRAPGSGFAHPLEHQPLVRGMLVDDHQPVLGFGDDIGRRHLPARHAERILHVGGSDR